MKISKNKKSVNGSKIVNNSKSYDSALKHIYEAIDCLGITASEDTVAKDAIANLGVVALDLNSNK